MAYTAYLDEKVFNDNSLNVAVNSLYDYLTEHSSYSPSDLALSGNAALIVQGSLDLQPVRVIPFIMTSKSLYDHLTSNLKLLWPSAQIIKFKDRLQVILYGVYIEFWFSGSSITSFAQDGIILQDADDIPNYLK